MNQAIIHSLVEQSSLVAWKMLNRSNQVFFNLSKKAIGFFV